MSGIQYKTFDEGISFDDDDENDGLSLFDESACSTGEASFARIRSTAENVSLLHSNNNATPLEDVPESHVRFSNLYENAKSFRVVSGKKKAKEQNVKGIIFPWLFKYKVWWSLTVVGAAITIFFETFVIAFSSSSLSIPFTGEHFITEYMLSAIFVTDVAVHFNLAFYNSSDDLVFERKLIAQNYLSCMFWVDFIAVFPFQFLANFLSGTLGEDTIYTHHLSLFRLLRMLRTYRIRDFFNGLQYDTRVPLFSLTMIRNYTAMLIWTHIAACLLYFVAKQSDMRGHSTFLGDEFGFLDELESYLISLYWSVVTFATVGYGDFAPANVAEQLWAMFYMMSNIVIGAWIIGSITLLLIKKDEKTGNYRDTLENLDAYSRLHSFDSPFHKRLETQLKLDFNTREIGDEQVLKFFPASMRRKVLRRLYGPFLENTALFKGIRSQFADAFLSSCSVEIFSPGEEIMKRNAISSDLYLLVGGVVRYTKVSSSGSSVDTNMAGEDKVLHQKAGDFINEVGFFTESPQIDTITTVTVCKTLTISRSTYKLLAQDHPGSSGKILQNLLDKVEDMEAAYGAPVKSNIPVALGFLRAGSTLTFYDRSDSFSQYSRTNSSQEPKYPRSMLSALTSIKELVKMHIEKQQDDHTTRFLFAASREDTNTISVMCDQGFDPDSSDYDSRTALMVAAMKGNTKVVSRLLLFNANPNLTDMHGSTALYEAARTGHDDVMDVLLKNGAKLCMQESLAATILDRAVFDGDIPLLRRLLKANIQVNAVDYDRRGAVHLAAAEGNLAALKLLVEFGADLRIEDRWGNKVNDEANRSKSFNITTYLRSLEETSER